jgi:pimeloyl-ACP methyl ester carboxylesterase
VTKSARLWSGLVPPAHRRPDWHDTRRITTDDGVGIALHRHPARGSRRRPVLLVHGLSANRFTFDFPGRSFADYLANHGFDAWVLELRGAGQSERPRTFSVEHYVNYDLPAAVRAVREATGADQLHWMGHSLGGILLFAYACTAGEAELASGVTIGSALDYSKGGSTYARLTFLKPLIERLGGIPWGSLTHFIAPACGRFPNPVEAFNVCFDNLEPEHARRLHADCFERIPAALAASLLPLLTTGVLEHTAEYRSLALPVLMLGGSRDPQCSTGMVEATAADLKNAETFLLGRSHGHPTDYGHFDMLIGKRATSEVWPRLLRWLETHDGKLTG